MSDLWTDICEPKSLNDIVGQTEFVKILQEYVKIGHIPNMTIAGKPGSGKTLLIKLFAVELGFTKYDENGKQIDLIPGQFFLMNASSSRGIDFVRTTIKRLSEKPTIGNLPRLIVLDEFDFTSEAQGAMRALIQESSDNVRFILITNYPETIIEPILSRCPMKIIPPLKLEDLKIITEKIQKVKNFKITPECVELLFKITKGDVRAFIGKLQDACLISNYDVDVKHIQLVDTDIQIAKSILEVSQIDYEQSRGLMTTEYMKTENAKNFLEVMFKAVSLTKFSEIPQNNEIIQMRIRDRIAEIDFRITQSTNILVQLNSLINYIRLIKFIPLQCPKAK